MNWVRRVNRWSDAQSGWTLLAWGWGFTLTGAFLGLLVARVFATQPLPSFTSQLPWTFGGSLLTAIAGTAGALSRRRRERRRAGAA